MDHDKSTSDHTIQNILLPLPVVINYQQHLSVVGGGLEISSTYAGILAGLLLRRSYAGNHTVVASSAPLHPLVVTFFLPPLP